MNRVSPRPLLIAWFCSGHSPPLSQTGQSSGWLISRNSICPCWALSATGEVAWVLTTMPSATVIVHEACGFGMPRPLPASGTSTRHWRQAPTGASSGWSQNRGICTPTCSAARITRVFLGTETSMPSMVRVTSSDFSGCRLLGLLGGRRHAVTASSANTVEAIRSNGQPPWVRWARYSSRKYLIEDGDRADRTVGQGAERPAEDVVADVVEHVEVALLPAALLEVGQGLHQPPGALAARRALAARLVLVELGPAQHGPHHAGGLVEDLQRAGAEHRARRADTLEVEGYVEVLGGEQRGAGAARGPELQLVALAHAAGEVDQLAQGDAQRCLELAGVGARGRRARRSRSPWTSRCPSRRTTRRRGR